jgi:hypothetical protein
LLRDKKEVEHLQKQYLSKIETMVKANERCLELFAATTTLKTAE